jgi:hypothetical protein
MSSTQTTTRNPPAAAAKPVDKAIVPKDKPLKRYSREEVGKHNKEGDVVSDTLRSVEEEVLMGCLGVVGHR